MEEQLVSFTVAKLAKEKGFDELVLNHYNSPHDIFQDDVKNSELEHDEYSAPTQSLLQKWLEEKHRIFVETRVYIKDCLCKYILVIKIMKNCEIQINSSGVDFPSKIKALEEGLSQALKLLP